MGTLTTAILSLNTMEPRAHPSGLSTGYQVPWLLQYHQHRQILWLAPQMTRITRWQVLLCGGRTPRVNDIFCGVMLQEAYHCVGM